MKTQFHAVLLLAVATAVGAACNDPIPGFSPDTRVSPVPGNSTIDGGGGAPCPGGFTGSAGPNPQANYCNNGQGFGQQPFNEECMPSPDWVPGPGLPPVPVRMFTPAPHPDTECPFYRGAYQNWMIAMTPLGSNAKGSQLASDPVLVNYPTIDDAFAFTTKHAPRNTGTVYPKGKAAHDALVGKPATGRAWLGVVRQAGFRNVLVDQDNHTLFYGLHMNQAFYDFVKANKLDTVKGILSVDPNLALPPGLVEFKTAWKDIDPQDFPNGVVPPPPEGDFGVQDGNPAYMIPQGAKAATLPTMGKAPTWDDN
ncbi:MAG: hypothetical protein JOZ69_09995, partial [Myxococcales bacterium]|nr:hypothetical protein [Myxococcales bacterium]